MIMTKKKEQVQDIEENAEVIDLKNINFKEFNYFPIGSNNKVRLQFPYGTDYYIMTKDEFSYKGFVINEKYQKGLKFCEGRNESDILNKIPHYWG